MSIYIESYMMHDVVTLHISRFVSIQREQEGIVTKVIALLFKLNCILQRDTRGDKGNKESLKRSKDINNFVKNCQKQNFYAQGKYDNDLLSKNIWF